MKPKLNLARCFYRQSRMIVHPHAFRLSPVSMVRSYYCSPFLCSNTASSESTDDLDQKVDSMIEKLQDISNVAVESGQSHEAEIHRIYQELHEVVTQHKHKHGALFLVGHFLQLISVAPKSESLQDLVNLTLSYMTIAYDPNVKQSVIYKLTMTPPGEERDEVIQTQLDKGNLWVYVTLADIEPDLKKKIDILKKGGDDLDCLIKRFKLMISMEPDEKGGEEIIDVLDKIMDQSKPLVNDENSPFPPLLYAQSATQLGALKLKTGDIERALELFEEAASYHEPQSYLCLATYYQDVKDVEASLKWALKGMEDANSTDCAKLVLQYQLDGNYTLTSKELGLLELHLHAEDQDVRFLIAKCLLANHLSARQTSTSIELSLPNPSVDSKSIAKHLLELNVDHEPSKQLLEKQ